MNFNLIFIGRVPWAPWASPGLPGGPQVSPAPQGTLNKYPDLSTLAGLLRHLGALVPWSIQGKR